MPTSPNLDDVASRSGFDPEMIAYLSAKGISNSGLFLHYFKDQAKIPLFFEPLSDLAGYDLAGSTIKGTDDERLILEAATRAPHLLPGLLPSSPSFAA